MHGLNNNFLYTAKHIITYWNTSSGIVESTGTGFFIQKDSDLYLITNRHVVELTYAHPEYAGATLKEFYCEGYENMNANNLPEKLEKILLKNTNNFVFHPNYYNDIACLKNPQVDPSIPQSHLISLPLDYSLLATKEMLDEKLIVCDRIAYPGFPEGYDKKNCTPIFRMGTIASDPRFGYAYDETHPDRDLVAYEGFSSGGASGSPVFAIQKGFTLQINGTLYDSFFRKAMLVGINAGHLSYATGHSGISYFYKSSAIIETISACN